MKHIKTIICISFLLFSLSISEINAATLKLSTTTEPEIFTIETTLTINSQKIQPFSTAHTISATKSFTLKALSGNTIAVFSLHGTFCYNNSDAVCTKATYSSNVFNDAWCYTNRTAYQNNNKALGSFKIKNKNTSHTVSESLTLTCSNNGTIS